MQLHHGAGHADGIPRDDADDGARKLRLRGQWDGRTDAQQISFDARFELMLLKESNDFYLSTDEHRLTQVIFY